MSARRCRRIGDSRRQQGADRPDATVAHDPHNAAETAVHDPETGEVRADCDSARLRRDHESAWERAAEDDKERARQRLAAVRRAEALIAIGIPRASADATAAAETGATARAVGDWRRKVKGLPQGTRVHALLDRKPTGRPPKIAGEVREILEALAFHNPAHLTAKHCHRTLMARLGHAPAKSTISHWLAAWRREYAHDLSAVSNPDRHRSHRKPAGGDAAAHIERLNQEWELDSTPADVICNDGLRYAVVVAIDIWSRRTRGLVAPTSRAAAIAALFRRCLLDWGVPELVRTDEGADYTSRHVVGVIADLELDHDICPPFTPDAKPFVERVIKTISHDLFANLPGFTGHNVAQAQALRARKSFAERRRAGRARNPESDDDIETFRVALSAEQLQAYLDRWCDDVYGREPHDGLGGLSPFERVRSWTGQIKHIGNVRALDALLAAPADDGWRTVGKGGIRLDKIDYIAGPLGAIVGERVRVRRDPADLDRIFVYQADGTFVCVAQDPARTGADRAAVAAAMKRAYNERGRRARARARELAKRHRPERAMVDVLDKAAEDAERVVALPRPRSARASIPRASGATSIPRASGATSIPRASGATTRPTRPRRCAKPHAPPMRPTRPTRARRAKPTKAPRHPFPNARRRSPPRCSFTKRSSENGKGHDAQHRRGNRRHAHRLGCPPRRVRHQHGAGRARDRPPRIHDLALAQSQVQRRQRCRRSSGRALA